MKRLFILSSIIVLVGCTITKRHFGPGYHVEWKKSHAQKENGVTKTNLSDFRKDPPEEAETALQAMVSPIDSGVQKNEVVIGAFEINDPFYRSDSEPESDEVLSSLVERKSVLEEPDHAEDQPKRRVEPFTLAALGSLLLCLLLLLTIGFSGMTLAILIGLGILMIAFSIVSLIRIVRNPTIYKAKGLTWTLFWISMAGTGIGLFILIFYLLVMTNNIDLF